MEDMNKLATIFGIGFNSASMVGELEKIEQKKDFNYNLFSDVGKKFIEYSEYAFCLKKRDAIEKLLGKDSEYYRTSMELLTGDLENINTKNREEYRKRRDNFIRVKSTIESIINKEEGIFKEDIENTKKFFDELSDKA